MGLRPSVSSGNRSSKENDVDENDVVTTQGSNFCNNTTPQSSDDSRSVESTPLPPVKRKAWTERGQLLLNFHDVISRAINSPEMIEKCSQISRDMSNQEGDTASTSQPKKTPSLACDYSAEANLIIENKARRDAEVRNKTLAVGFCMFCFLRGGRGVRSWMRNATASRYARYTFDSLPLSGGNGIKPASSKPMPAEQPTKLRWFFRLAVDVTLSTTLALFSGEYLFIPRPSSYIEDMAKLPLVEGKSLYAEMVCPPLLKEYKHVLEKYGRWPVMSFDSITNDEAETATANGSEPTLTQEDVSLNTIRKFVENCSRRSKYEQAVLQERNALAKHNRDHNNVGLELFHRIREESYNYSKERKEELVKLGDVKVPSGGVPEDVDVDLETEIMYLDDDEQL